MEGCTQEYSKQLSCLLVFNSVVFNRAVLYAVPSGNVFAAHVPQRGIEIVEIFKYF